MYIMANGKMVEVPTNGKGQANVKDIKQAAGIDPNRLLVRQTQDGGNEVVRSDRQININPNDVFDDMPQHKRGEEKAISK